MKHKLFIDGQEGTTGLEITERLASHPAVELIKIDPDKRKDPTQRQKLMAEAEITFLCLPDAAAREAVALAEGTGTRIIDASTAHRIANGWVYGLPELGAEQRTAIAAASRVANPGCYATGFISLVQPLVAAGVLNPQSSISCNAVSGYSGGGKPMIADYETDSRADAFDLPRYYGLGQSHKHLPEMQKLTGLTDAPVFLPSVGDYYRGMLVFVPLAAAQLNKPTTLAEVWQTLVDHYSGQRFVKVLPLGDGANGGRMVNPSDCAGSNELHIGVYGNDVRMLLCASLDNLGKGASGAAVQNMNIMLGLDEATALK